MSKRNYTNYSKKNENLEPEVVETDPIEVMQMSVPESELEAAPAVVEATVAPKNLKVGNVTNCTKLNVRAKPDANGHVVTVIDAGSEVEIDLDLSTSEWYKVNTFDNVSGYCMRKFITVR